MNIGGRILLRLAELGWERNDLLAKLPDLTPQNLSQLIVRDSKRSEWDEAIAEALGVHVMWLVYGKTFSYLNQRDAQHANANSSSALSPLSDENHCAGKQTPNQAAEPAFKWPFPLVEQDRWNALLPTGKEHVQAAMNNAISLCESAGLMDTSRSKRSA